MESAFYTLGPCYLSELPYDTYVITVWASIARRASQGTFFEMGLSRTLSNIKGVPTLYPNSCVRGRYMHLISYTNSINDMTWTCRPNEWMFGMSQ